MRFFSDTEINMYKRRIILLVFATLVIFIEALSDIGCDSSLSANCTGNGRCFVRQAVNGSNYICECTGLRTTGYKCDSRVFLTKNISGCYGSSCNTGTFSSQNYPSNYSYNNSLEILLVYVPGNLRFSLSFDNNFKIEKKKDHLYIGPGLSPPFVNHPGHMDTTDNTVLHYFNGDKRPDDFNITSDTLYMYWATDNSLAYQGFRVNWTSIAIDVNCPNSPIIITVPANGTNRANVTWDLPMVYSGVGYDNLNVTSNYSPGDILEIGEYSVVYIYRDIYRHTESCSFTLLVEDYILPVVNDCHPNLELTVCKERTINLTKVTMFNNNSSRMVDDSFLINNGVDGEVVLGRNIISFTIVDEHGNRATCEYNINLTIDCGKALISPEIPTWTAFLVAAGLAALLFLILAIFVFVKLRAVYASKQANLSFNPDNFTGHKPGSPLEYPEPPTAANKKRKSGTYDIQTL